MSGSYREWQQISVEVAGEKFVVATKPGVPAHGITDTASILLVQHVRVAKDDTLVYMNSGNGLAPTVGAVNGRAKRIISTDRNIVSIHATSAPPATNPSISSVNVSTASAMPPTPR